MALVKKHRRREAGSFCNRIVHLVSEPNFVQFEHILREPNIFKIVGRSHYERWHSCFWGWLLDPQGTHLLREYAFVRLLLLLSDKRALQPVGDAKCRLLKALPAIEFSDVEVAPNEFVPHERSVDGIGRFDIFLTARYTSQVGEPGRLNAIVEFKIDSKPTREQSEKYATWLFSTHPNDANMLIYVSPSLGQTSEQTACDRRWYCINYQTLNDLLLSPLLEHPGLNDKVRPFIIQYVKNLKIPQKGIKMAITEEETKMALALYEKYGDVFDAIFDALVAAKVIEHGTSDIRSGRGRAKGRLAVKIAGQVVTGEIVSDLFSHVLTYLVDSKIIKRVPLPWGTSDQRYIVTNQKPPTHPSGRTFFYPIEYKGYTMESHYSRERAIQVLTALCRQLEVKFEVIDN